MLPLIFKARSIDFVGAKIIKVSRTRSGGARIYTNKGVLRISLNTDKGKYPQADVVGNPKDLEGKMIEGFPFDIRYPQWMEEVELEIKTKEGTSVKFIFSALRNLNVYVVSE